MSVLFTGESYAAFDLKLVEEQDSEVQKILSSSLLRVKKNLPKKLKNTINQPVDIHFKFPSRIYRKNKGNFSYKILCDKKSEKGSFRENS